MMNILKIDGHKAIIKYDPEIDSFRGEFLDLNGGADFYASNIEELKKEGRVSLKTYLDSIGISILGNNKARPKGAKFIYAGKREYSHIKERGTWWRFKAKKKVQNEAHRPHHIPHHF